VLISTYGVEHLVASPQQVLALAAMREASPGYQIEPLNTIWIAGAFTSTEAIKRVQTSLCRNIIMGYASTEGALVAFATHEMIANIPDAVGFVGPWVNLEIVDDAGHQVAAGAEGRIRYRTPFFVKNHLANNPDSKADPRDLWYYPGDLGYVTENGVLCVRGRGDDVINCGGQKFSAASLDEIVLTCSGVKDAGVCGFKGDTDLEEVWIGVVPTAAFALAEFQRQLEQHPRFSDLLRSVGAEVVLVDSIPRSLLGKIQRRELRDKLKSAERGAPTTG
jgi:acyl-coenzyme A synthetase/AMP-(fatty) acid ligase